MIHLFGLAAPAGAVTVDAAAIDVGVTGSPTSLPLAGIWNASQGDLTVTTHFLGAMALLNFAGLDGLTLTVTPRLEFEDAEMNGHSSFLRANSNGLGITSSGPLYIDSTGDHIGAQTWSGGLAAEALRLDFSRDVQLISVNLWTMQANAQPAARVERLQGGSPVLDENRNLLGRPGRDYELETAEGATAGDRVVTLSTLGEEWSWGRVFQIAAVNALNTNDPWRGFRLQGFRFALAPLLPPPEPSPQDQDLSPFRFSAGGFDAFIDPDDPDNDDCIVGGALSDAYAIPIGDQCRSGGAGKGWTFELPGEAARVERLVDGNEVATVGYGLSLTVAGGAVARQVNNAPDTVIDEDNITLEADGSGPDAGRGLGVRTQNPSSDIDAGAPGSPHIDSPNLARRLNSPCGSIIPDSIGCSFTFDEFIELNFSEFEYDRRTSDIPGATPLETLSLERIELTGLEIWTQTQIPQRFQLRALQDEAPTENRLNDPVVTQLDLVTNNALPCAPLHGGTGAGTGYCQSFSLSLVSHVGRFLIIGTQLADYDDTVSGIRLRTIQYRFQTAMGLPLPGGLVLALTGLAGLGGFALRRRLGKIPPCRPARNASRRKNGSRESGLRSAAWRE